MTSRARHRPAFVCLVAMIALAVTGCAPALEGDTVPPSSGGAGAPYASDDPGSGSDWVVLTFRGTQEFDDQLMTALEQTETEADEALQRAGAGAIDGNEIGDREYQLYFVGQDRDEMWQILRPVVDRAPVAWEQAELRHTLDDPQPQVVAHP